MPVKKEILLTPGPLTSSEACKRAMLRDYGSRDQEFIQLVRMIRSEILAIAEADSERFTVVPMQGSGTFGLEAVVSTVVQPGGRIAVIENGVYGRRISQMARIHGIEVSAFVVAENQCPDLRELDAFLAKEANLAMLVAVHCETTTGILNPIKECGELARKHSLDYMVDAMSSFGGIPLSLQDVNCDYLVSSSNKCLEGVPGFSFVIANKDKLFAAEGRARTLSLDLLSQYRGLEANGQFRFTPPTHCFLAFAQALAELREEGGVLVRYQRYQENQRVLAQGMRELGFELYLDESVQSPIISSFLYPQDDFDFEAFYQRLKDSGFVIYPGKLAQVSCFRVGTIGQVEPVDIRRFLAEVSRSL